MYRSALTGDLSQPGARRLLAVTYRTTKYPDVTRREYDEEADEYYDVTVEGPVGKDIVEEIPILPGEVDLARELGYTVSDDDVRLAVRGSK